MARALLITGMENEMLPRSNKPVLRVCAWCDCRSKIVQKIMSKSVDITHGICENCFARMASGIKPSLPGRTKTK